MKTINEKYQFDAFIDTPMMRKNRFKFRESLYSTEMAGLALRTSELVQKLNDLLKSFGSKIEATSVTFDQTDDCYIWSVK